MLLHFSLKYFLSVMILHFSHSLALFNQVNTLSFTFKMWSGSRRPKSSSTTGKQNFKYGDIVRTLWFSSFIVKFDINCQRCKRPQKEKRSCKWCFFVLFCCRVQRHPFERMATPFQVYSWTAPQVDHAMDCVRAEDAYTSRLGYEEHIPGQVGTAEHRSTSGW